MRASLRWWWQLAVLWWRDPTQAWVIFSYYAYARAAYCGRLVAWRRARPTFTGAFDELPNGYGAMMADAVRAIQREEGGTLWVVRDPPSGGSVDQREAMTRLAEIGAVTDAAATAEQPGSLRDPTTH